MPNGYAALIKEVHDSAVADLLRGTTGARDTVREVMAI